MAWNSYPSVPLYVDNLWGKYTIYAFQYRMRKLGYYKRALDGKSGHHTRVAMQKFLHKYGGYRGRYDGDLGSLSTKAMLKFMNNKYIYTPTWPKRFPQSTLVRGWQLYLNDVRTYMYV